MSGCLGKTQVVLYIHETSLLDFLSGQKVQAWRQMNMVRTPANSLSHDAITVVIDHSCVELKDGNIYVTCKEIIKPAVIG